MVNAPIESENEESDDDENKICKGSIVPSDNDIECNAMTKLKIKS